MAAPSSPSPRRTVRAAGWLYLGASHAASLALFAFFASIAARTGGWEIGPMRERGELAPLFWLAGGPSVLLLKLPLLPTPTSTPSTKTWKLPGPG